MTAPSRPRIGLFGGSFDPVHNAHVALAQLSLADLSLDEIRWLPAGRPWQKTERPLAADEHRLAMLRLALEGQARHAVDDRELRRAGPSYTIDTVLELQAEISPAECFLILGQDQYARLHTWHRWQELLAQVTLAVAGRAGEALKPSPEVAAVPHRVVAVSLPPMAVSATEIRDRIAQGRTIEGLVPAAVARYIGQYHLYLGTSRN